jgi:hypothetical protein
MRCKLVQFTLQTILIHVDWGIYLGTQTMSKGFYHLSMYPSKIKFGTITNKEVITNEELILELHETRPKN